jgi:hypothetical protein
VQSIVHARSQTKRHKHSPAQRTCASGAIVSKQKKTGKEEEEGEQEEQQEEEQNLQTTHSRCIISHFEWSLVQLADKLIKRRR